MNFVIQITPIKTKSCFQTPIEIVLFSPLV